MKTINVRKRLIFKFRQFFSCLLIFCFIFFVGENQRIFPRYGQTKHWGLLKTAFGNSFITPMPFIIMGAGLAAMLYALSDDPLILSDLEDFLKTDLLTGDFSREEIIGIIEGFLISRALKDDDVIENLNEDQKSKLMTLLIVLSSTQSNEKKEIRTLLSFILEDILHEIWLTDTLFTEEAVIKTRLIETMELTALNLRKNANRIPFIDEIEYRLKSILEKMTDSNQRNREIIDKVNQARKMLSELQKNQHPSTSHVLEPDFSVETFFSGFKTLGINQFIELLKLDKKRISGLIEGFLMFKLLESDGDLMTMHPNQHITLWTEEQKIKLMVLSVGLSFLILNSKKNQEILLSELEDILDTIRRSTKNYKGERIEIKYQLIEALGSIASNLVKINKQSIIDDSFIHFTLTSMIRSFAKNHEEPTIRLKVLELIEKVGQINIKQKGKLDVYELNDLLIQLTEDKDPSVKQKALLVKKNLHPKVGSSCFGIF